MSATYHAAVPAYDNAIQAYPTAVAHQSRSRVVRNDCKMAQRHRYNPLDAHLACRPPNKNTMPSLTNRSLNTAPYPAAGPPASAQQRPIYQKHIGHVSPVAHDSLIYHSLRLPRCISPTGGSLPDFAAQMTCLFWFDSLDPLRLVGSTIAAFTTRPSRLPHLVVPPEQFRKWTFNILSTTQVTQNVVFLALLFIYRLRMSTPQIKGRAGSEYRLLIIALMLGNKFLDDNTYTNKTWAEVSGFKVQEIHVMEVEFLSNMRYNLLASKSQWEDWLFRLTCFHGYYNYALTIPPSPVHALSPFPANHSPVSSPTPVPMPALTEQRVPLNFAPSVRVSPPPFAPPAAMARTMAVTTSPLSKRTRAADRPSARKRSQEDDLAEHPAKRPVVANLGQPGPVYANSRPNLPAGVARASVPPLTLVTGPGNQQAGAYVDATLFPHGVLPGQHPVLPLQLGARSLPPGFYPGPGPSTTPQPAMPAVPHPPPAAVANYPVASLPNPPALRYSTPKKHRSPDIPGPYTASPVVDHLGPASAIHTPTLRTPISNSPSVYLQQRASPYKPVRHVNTLLYPPPSASLDQYHLAVPMQPSQMHYQPLGRRYDVRTGVVPEFVVFNRGQQQPQQQQQQQQQQQSARMGQHHHFAP